MFVEENEITETSPQTVMQAKILQMLIAAEEGTIEQQDVENGIMSAIGIARNTAIEVAMNEQRQKSRHSRGKPVRQPAPEEAYTNQCGNMAAEIEILLENPAFEIRHHQLNKQGYDLNHHFLSLSWKDKTWIIDASAPQSVPYMKSVEPSPAMKEFLEKGFFDTDQPEMNEAFHQFYSAVDKRASFSKNMGELLSVTRDNKPDLQDIADEFVFYPQKIRRGMMQAV